VFIAAPFYFKLVQVKRFESDIISILCGLSLDTENQVSAHGLYFKDNITRAGQISILHFDYIKQPDIKLYNFKSLHNIYYQTLRMGEEGWKRKSYS